MDSSEPKFKPAGLVSDSAADPAAPTPVEAPAFAPDDLICERYKVVRFIARGGMGAVYEVEDQELQARVALKIIAPDRTSSTRQASRFRQEIQHARRVTHPSVCRVFDLGRHRDASRGDVLFLTMELLEGETLAAYLRRHGPMTCEEAMPVIRQIVSALAAAHQVGIVHRDLKPANVMLLAGAPDPVVKVTDFGLATDPQSEETRSVSTDIVGTPEYMAPEQFRGQCSIRTDVYALGVTVFQMLTGHLPVSFEAPFKSLPAEISRHIPQSWQTAVTKCLSVHPGERFATVQEFWRAVSGETLTGQFERTTIVSPMQRHRTAAIALGALLLAVVALFVAGIIPNPFRRLPAQKHIAVFPFRNIGDDPANQAFAEGVAESLTSKLSQLERYQKSFWVVPASDTRTMKTLDEAYRDLGVTLAVTGSIEHTSDGVDVTANVVDPVKHRQLASRSMHINSANLDVLQQRVWESVAEMLDLEINTQMKQELAAGGTTQAAAYELYEQGNGYLQRYDLEDVDHAIELFNKALVKDPTYALAFAGLGAAYASKYSITKDPQWIAEATRNAGRAVELNDQLVPVRISLGRVYEKTGQLDKALAEYQRAMTEDPSTISAELQIAGIYVRQGKYRAAEEAYKDMIRRRPEYWFSYAGLGQVYYDDGQFAQAVSQFQSVVDLAPDNPLGYYNLGGSYIALGRYEEAIAVLKKGLSLKPNADAWTNLGAAYMYLGKYQEAADAMKRAADLSPHNHVMWRNLGDSYDQIPSRLPDARQAYEKALETATAELKINPKDPEVLSGIALYHAHLGNSQEAESFIHRALEVAPNNSDTLFTAALVYEIIGYPEKALTALDQAVKAGYSLEEIEKEPELKGLRSDPRYQQWLEQTKKQMNDSSKASINDQEERYAPSAGSSVLFVSVAVDHVNFVTSHRHQSRGV